MSKERKSVGRGSGHKPYIWCKHKSAC